MQVDRIARERQFTNIQKDILLANIQQLTQGPQLLILGERRVNVLKLNLQLDKMENIKTDKLGNNISNK
jgi:K+-transporting ATPase c subunit